MNVAVCVCRPWTICWAQNLGQALLALEDEGDEPVDLCPLNSSSSSSSSSLLTALFVGPDIQALVNLGVRHGWGRHLLAGRALRGCAQQHAAP